MFPFQWPAKEIAPVHESAHFDSSFVIVDGDDLPVEQQDIDRVSPDVLTVFQEDRNSVNLCQDSSQHLNDLQEQTYLVKLCKMKLPVEDRNHKAQSQCIQQPLICSLSSSVSTSLQLDLNTASTSALKTPRMILEEISQVTVPESPVFPHEILKICIQKESQCSTSSLESVDAEAETKCLKKPSVSAQKDIHKSACSSDGSEHMPSIKPVVLSSVTECLNKTDLEECYATQPEVVDKNIQISQSDEDGVVSQASLSSVNAQETHSTSDLVLSHSEFQMASLKWCPPKSTRKMLEFATSSSYLLNPAVMTASSASHSSQINTISITKGRSLLTESAEECTPVECMAQLSPTESAAHESGSGRAAQLFPLECSAHQIPTRSTTQISATEFIVQLSTLEPTAQISPAESTSQLNLVESTVQISTAESTTQLSVVESMTQLSPAKLLSSLSISQMPLTRSTAQVSSAACHVTSDFPVGQSSSSSAAFSSHSHKLSVPRKLRKRKKVNYCESCCTRSCYECFWMT